MNKIRVPPQQAFVITVGVPNANKDVHCKRAIRVLEQAGYHAGPTSDASITELADRIATANDTKDTDA